MVKKIKETAKGGPYFKSGPQIWALLKYSMTLSPASVKRTPWALFSHSQNSESDGKFDETISENDQQSRPPTPPTAKTL